jgi:quercetin dioxygenase-like cupin family protein
LVTGKESDNAFAVVGTAGSHSAPIGFHFHREAHDVFLCLKGQVNVWAGDTQCRTLSQGDFASVPPGVVHQYQILGPYTEFVGLIVPGGWEEFFRFIGEPYDTQGPLYPLTDDRNVFEVLIPKLKAAAEKFDMVPVPDHRGVEPQPWADDTDNTLPGVLEPYFLRAGSGPRYLLGGIVASPLIGTAESNNRFSIGSIEGSSWHEKLARSPLSETFTFDDVHHAFQVAEGSMTFILNGSESATLNVGETIYIPARTSFSMQIKSRYTKIYAFISGEGIMDLLCKAGKPYHQPVPPEKTQDWDRASLEALQEELKFRM